MEDLYSIARTVALYATALAAVVAGFKIYHKWNRGEPVIPLIFTWVLSIIIAVGLLQMIGTFIYGGAIYASNLAPSTVLLAQEAHSAAIVVGVVVAIVAVIHIYYRYNSGDDVTELVYRWVGSIFFLFSFGLIIEMLMS